uniref:Uncharacterized protein n=1 Tax=Rhizophora mucronata TaxID=61149 RepID=A0A2P2JEL6_RHIMU
MKGFNSLLCISSTMVLLIISLRHKLVQTLDYNLQKASRWLK